MIYLLCIETTTDVCSVCLSQQDQIISQLSTNTPKTHAAQLNSLIKQLLANAQLDIKQLSAIVYSAGPGSYSGLRIGISVAQGLCYGLEIPLINVNTLYALAVQAKKMYNSELKRNKTDLLNVKYIAITDARQEVYYAVYDEQLNEISPTTATKLDQKTFEHLHDDQKIFCGSALINKQHLLPTHNAIFLTTEQCYYNAQNLASIGYQQYCQQHYENIAYTTPYYFKISTYNQINNF